MWTFSNFKSCLILRKSLHFCLQVTVRNAWWGDKPAVRPLSQTDLTELMAESTVAFQRELRGSWLRLQFPHYHGSGAQYVPNNKLYQLKKLCLLNIYCCRQHYLRFSESLFTIHRLQLIKYLFSRSGIWYQVSQCFASDILR